MTLIKLNAVIQYAATIYAIFHFKFLNFTNVEYLCKSTVMLTCQLGNQNIPMLIQVKFCYLHEQVKLEFSSKSFIFNGI